MSHVRSMRALGLALVAMCLFSAVAAANASAAVWRKAGVELAAAENSTGSGTLELSDKKGGAFGEEVTVRCSGSTTGKVGPGAADKTETVTVNACETVKGQCGNPSASAVNLPWNTTLAGAAPVRDQIKNGGAGAPGYAVKCTVLGVTATDTCTSERGQPKVLELNVSPVKLEFDPESGTADCSRGGAEQGFVRGTVSINNATGNLSVG